MTAQTLSWKGCAVKGINLLPSVDCAITFQTNEPISLFFFTNCITVFKGTGCPLMGCNSCQNCFASFLTGVYSKRKDSDPLGRKFIPFTVHPFSEIASWTEKQSGSHKLGLLSKNFPKIYQVWPVHNNTYNQICATSEDSDQPAHPCSLISLCWSHVLQPPGYPNRDKREPCHTGWMHWLIWIFACHIGLILVFHALAHIIFILALQLC